MHDIVYSGPQQKQDIDDSLRISVITYFGSASNVAVFSDGLFSCSTPNMKYVSLQDCE